MLYKLQLLSSLMHLIAAQLGYGRRRRSRDGGADAGTIGLIIGLVIGAIFLIGIGYYVYDNYFSARVRQQEEQREAKKSKKEANKEEQARLKREKEWRKQMTIPLGELQKVKDTQDLGEVQQNPGTLEYHDLAGRLKARDEAQRSLEPFEPLLDKLFTEPLPVPLSEDFKNDENADKQQEISDEWKKCLYKNEALTVKSLLFNTHVVFAQEFVELEFKEQHVDENGNVYTGTVNKEGKIHGCGILFEKCAEITAGLFSNGEPHGYVRKITKLYGNKDFIYGGEAKSGKFGNAQIVKALDTTGVILEEEIKAAETANPEEVGA